MSDAQSLSVDSPRPAAPVSVAPKKDQEDLNIETYQRVFGKCLAAADKLVKEMTLTENSDQRKLVVDIGRELFSRFYDDQNAMKQSKHQADSMVHAITTMLEGRR